MTDAEVAAVAEEQQLPQSDADVVEEVEVVEEPE